ncbi:MAG: DUF4360 domain-containing protein [Bacteriovorax sp.]|nr:DUF4360 domain-containing protein [Bacteriovorax sp.]
MINSKTLRHSLFLALAILNLISLAKAENIRFENIRVGGTGCPSDVTQIIMAPDLSSASILFQSFESHVPVVVNSPKATPYISILNCNVFLDIQLPKGQKLESLEINYDMRGHAFLDRGVNGNFKSYMISTSGLGTERPQGVQLLQERNWSNISADQDEDFTVQTTKNQSVQSQCSDGQNGNSVSIHLQHQLASQITSGFERTNASGTITMDSSDIKGGIKLRAITSTCVSSSGNGGRNCRVVRVNGRSQMVCQ